MQPHSLPFVADPEGNSRAGAEYAAPKAGTQLARVYAAIQQQGPVTDRQLATITGLPINVICARRWHLLKKDLIESAGSVIGACGTRNTRYRCTAKIERN